MAFDCHAGTKHQLPADVSALGVLTSSIAAACEILTPSHEHPSVVRLPAPDTHGIGLYDFSHSAQLVSHSYELATEFLPANPELTLLPSRSAA